MPALGHLETPRNIRQAGHTLCICRLRRRAVVSLGPVVRISPNDLSLNSARSWSDLYGHRKGRVNPFVNSVFYDGGNFADQAHSIVSERDPQMYHQMRRFLSRAFSDTSWMDQEALAAKNINCFIRRIGREETVDLTHWFNLLTFGAHAPRLMGKPISPASCQPC